MADTTVWKVTVLPTVEPKRRKTFQKSSYGTRPARETKVPGQDQPRKRRKYRKAK